MRGAVHAPTLACLLCLLQAPGNGEPFLELVRKMTGAPLSSQAWEQELQVGGVGEQGQHAVRFGPAHGPPRV